MIQFFNPWLLAGLAAIGLPVLVHFLTRPRPRLIRFPTLKFLVEAGSGRKAVHRLRSWTILALRCAAIAALVLVFARPFMRSAGDVGAPGAAGRAVLLIDGSLSMQAVKGGVSIFDKARAEAADVLRSFEDGDNANVLLFGLETKPLLPALTQNLAVLHEALLKAQPTMEAGEPLAGIQAAVAMLEGDGSIYVFSDFQRSNWTATELSVPPGARLFLRPVHETPVENVAVTAVTVTPPSPTVAEPIQLACSVVNYSPTSRRATLRLSMDGIARERVLSLGPYASEEAVFELTLPAAGRYPGSVSLEADALTADNRRYFTVPVSDALHVLMISDRGPEDPSGAAFYMGKAIVPRVEQSGGIVLHTRHSHDADALILEQADIYVLITPADIPTHTLEVLLRRVVNGAGFICVMDGPGVPGLLQSVGGISNGAVTPPYELFGIVSSSVSEGDALQLGGLVGSPLAAFAGPGHGDFGEIRFSRHFRTGILAERRDEVLMTFADGAAAVTFSRADLGKAVFLNLPLTPDGGNFLGSPLFPAFVHEMLRHLRRAPGRTAVRIGETWQLSVPSPGEGEDTDEIRVVGPNDAPLTYSVVGRGRELSLALPKADVPGHYRGLLGTSTVALIAVNVDARESDTRDVALSSVEALMAAGAGGRVSVIQHDRELLRAGRNRPIWPALACLAAVFLAAEMTILAFWGTGWADGSA